MTKQELLAQKALYESHVDFKEQSLREFKSKLKSIDRALQELERDNQIDMFEEENNYGDFSGNSSSMYHDLVVNELDVMAELNS